MEESFDWKLLARYLSDECSEAERKRVEELMASDPRLRSMMNLMGDVWKTEEIKVGAADIDRLWSDLAARVKISAKASSAHAHPKRGRLFRWPFELHPVAMRLLRAAAVLVLAVGLSYLMTDGFKNLPFFANGSGMKKTAVGMTQRKELYLNDGTRVVLDAGSTFKYSCRFDGCIREVFLSGEGYFEAASDPARPFIVHAGDAVITVLGTRFNVRAWDPSRCVTVAVVEGRVAFGLGNVGEPHQVTLTRNQVSKIKENGTPEAPQTADIEKYIGWMHDSIAFEDVRLGEVLAQVERWYGVRFVLPDSSAADEHVSVHIQRKSIRDVLELISLISGLEYEMDGTEIRLKIKIN